MGVALESIAPMESIAPKIGRTAPTPLDWVRRETVDRGERGAILQPEIKRARRANMQVDGLSKCWIQMNRQRSRLKTTQTAGGNPPMPLTCLH
jgi:hypothetical protein